MQQPNRHNWGQARTRMSSLVTTSPRMAVTVMCSAALWCASCGSQLDPVGCEEAGPGKPLLIVDTEALEPPAVGAARAYKPELVQNIDPADPAFGQAAGFALTLLVGDVDQLSIQLVDTQSGTVTDLTKIAPPANTSEAELAGQLRAFGDTGREALQAAGGVYWIIDAPTEADPLRARVGVLLSQDLRPPLAQLRLFTRRLWDVPVNPEVIELVNDFFYFVVLGDSVQWGNGLREEDKMSTLVAKTLERELQRRVITERYAVSGARIVPAEGDGICELNCFGEVPEVLTSVSVQAELMQRPDLVDLILLDGCINDVGVGRIIDPFIDATELEEVTRGFCNVEMEALLREVREIAPQARIVVTGYYEVISPDSDLLGVQQFLATQNVVAEDSAEGLIAKLSANSTLFRDTAHESIVAAVESVNADIEGGPRVAFADPGYAPTNAIFGSSAWLWSMTGDVSLLELLGVNLDLAPEDPLITRRQDACPQLDLTLVERIICLYASVAHPNPPGARAFADAIEASLRQLGVLP